MRRSLFLLLTLGGLAFAPRGITAVRAAPAVECLHAPDISYPGDLPDDHSASPSRDAFSAPDAPSDDAPATGPALPGVAPLDPAPHPAPALALPRQKLRSEAVRLGGRVAAFSTVDPPPHS